MTPRLRLWAACSAVVLLALAPAAHAQTYTWNRDADDTWNAAGNWTPSAVPGGPGVAVVFGGVITADRAVTIDSPVSVGSLTFQSTSHSYTLGGGSTLTLDNGSSAALITMASTATANQTVTAAVSLASDLTVTNSSSTGTLALTGPITLGGHTVTVGGSGAVTFGTLTGGGNLTLSGSGVTALTSAASDFAGTVTLNSGVLAVGADAQLGAAANPLVIAGGTLRVTGSAPVATARPITLPNTHGVSTIDVQNTDPTSGFTVQSAIASGLGFNKTGAGVLTLAGANTFGGGVAVQAGTLRAAAANVLSPNGSLGITAGATVQLNGFSQSVTGLASTNSTSFNPSNLDLGTAAGTVLTLGRLNQFDLPATFAGKITGTGNLVKVGLGTQQIGSPVDPVSTFTGSTTVRQGVLELTSYVTSGGPSPLGNSTTAVKLGDAAFGGLDAALLNRDTTFSGFGRAIDVQPGTGYRTIGHQLSGLSLNGNVGQGYTVTYSGPITLGKDLQLYAKTDLNGNGATLAVGGTVSGAGGLVKIGAGEAQLLANNSYTGTTTVLNGQLTLAGASGAAPLSSGFVARTQGNDLTGLNFSQASLSLIKTANLAVYDFPANPNRLGNVDVTLDNGQFSYYGRGGGASAQAFRSLVLDRGPTTLLVQTGDTNATTTATLSLTGGLVRNNGATLVVAAAALGNPDGQNFTRVLAATPPVLLGGGGAAGTTNVSIVPWAYHDPDPNGTTSTSTETFLTYAPAVGLRPLADSEYVTGLGGAANGRLDNVRITTTADSIGSDLAVNSLRYGLTADGTITLNNGAKLTVAGGAILSTASTPTGKLTVTGGELAFGTAEGVIHTVGGNSNVVIASIVSGSGGLTSNVSGTLTLNGANTYTGPTTINAGSVSYNSPASFGAGGDPIRFGNALNGGMAYSGAGPATLPNPIEIGAGTTGISVSGGGTLTLAGVISGAGNGNPAGPIFAANAGVIQLRGANTFVGLTQITTGTVGIVANNSLGDPSNQLNLGSGTANNPVLRFDAASIELARLLFVQGNATINTNGFDGTISGPVAGSNTAFTLTKTGAGTLTLTGTSTYSGPTAVTGGTLRVNGTLASNGGVAGAVTVSAGGALGGSGTVDRPVVVSGGTLAPGAGVGTLTVRTLAFSTGSPAGYDWEAGAAAQDQVVATAGALDLTGVSLTVRLFDRGLGSGVSPNQRYPLITVAGANSVTGFNPSNMTADFAGAPNWVAGRYSFGLDATGSNTVVYMTGLTPVPEPAGLLAAAAVALAAVSRRRGPRTVAPATAPNES